MITRRASLFGLLAAPAIIRTPGLLIAIKAPRSYLQRVRDEYDIPSNPWSQITQQEILDDLKRGFEAMRRFNAIHEHIHPDLIKLLS